MSERRRRAAAFTRQDYGLLAIGVLTIIFLSAIAVTGRFPLRGGGSIELPTWSRPLVAISVLSILIYEGIVFWRHRSRR